MSAYIIYLVLPQFFVETQNFQPKSCTTYRRLSENVVATFTRNRNLKNMEAKQKCQQYWARSLFQLISTKKNRATSSLDCFSTAAS